MHDLKALRRSPSSFDHGWERRGLSPQASSLLDLDREARACRTKLETLLARRNTLSQTIASAPPEERNALVAESAALKEKKAQLEQESRHIEGKLHEQLAALPNLPSPDTPEGKNEDANVLLRQEGTPRSFDHEVLSHFHLGESLGLMDFKSAAQLSGARFVVLKGALARLERALATFMLHRHTTQHGYQEILPPFMVGPDALFGTGQLPKFKEDLFSVAPSHWLIPTGEVPLTNLASKRTFSKSELPLRFTCWTPCFRSEAGAAGKDTRGMIRLHQFSKVELVSLVDPSASEEEFERMLGCAEAVLRALDLPYQVLRLCCGDLCFQASKTYDLEVWLPYQNRYREVSSCSLCGDFQARRMGARIASGGGFLHTLNGSALAVGRTLVAVLENYQNQDGSVTVPEVLRPFMGCARIEREVHTG